ncbi:hypothetical protein BV22DRAFT_1041820 [Leucogyrophana mollusca]|uniref:Uncharacterized protein n=1 Tax=Leucogyrophana mollusca TaxID=85980 RepID=A0ACB8AZQ6_9AGAM|nr:hypothetical protein BV22DRAFT_1041820 [Leucogyrophana mollusca]
MASQEIQAILEEYIFNELPTHLLYVPHMRLMRREEVQMHFQPLVAEIGESLQDSITAHPLQTSRARTIRDLVKRRVKYAIFSHRWLRVGEPTFQDMLRGDMKGGPGYEKLKEFCNKAGEYGCDFVWSDTCCIDKTSSAELDEAIRSMCRWYQNSDVCIAYLADSTTIIDFEHEMWFRRGWTLQEMLAPKRIKLYNKGWIPFSGDENDKNGGNVLLAISSVTKIPLHDLEDFKPGMDRVAEKMSWASRRRTTRVEDVAYSLIGIFDVSLAIAYGEGERAFYRLLAAIIQDSNGLDIFYWKGERSLYNRALPKSPACYPWLDSRLLNSPGPQPALFNHGSNLVGDQSPALTNRGLRLNVLLVEVKFVRWQPAYAQHPDAIIEMVFRASPLHGLEEDVTITTSSGEYTIHSHFDYAVGIIDYHNMGYGEEVFADSSRMYTAFLLARARGERPGPPYEPWCKIPTENVVKIQPRSTIRSAPDTIYHTR